ncbi:MAG: type II secretion system secretin GspD [Desulfamplus sp.]|nr:type II secretion system secretin GspD [Desulfamplus sp.]
MKLGPGKSVPGESIIGESVPGESIVGESVPGESIVGEFVPGESIVGEFVPGTSRGGSKDVVTHYSVMADGGAAPPVNSSGNSSGNPPGNPPANPFAAFMKAREKSGNGAGEPLAGGGTENMPAGDSGVPLEDDSQNLNSGMPLEYDSQSLDSGKKSSVNSQNHNPSDPPEPLNPDTGDLVAVELAFDNADLFEVLDATLYELFKINYIIDPHVKAKVSFHFSGSYSREQFIELLNEILQLSNLSITRGPGDIFKVVRKSESGALGYDPIFEDYIPEASGDISRLIKLKYVDAASASKNIRLFTSKGAAISIDTVNNTLIVTDTRENVEKAMNIITLMDIPYFMDIAWRIFPVKEAQAKDLVSDITKIIRSSGLYYRPGALKGGYQILPINTMNAILVVTRWPEMLDLVEAWIAAMDKVDEDTGGGTGVFVYFVENGVAADLADILKQLYGAKKTSSDQKTRIVTPVATPQPDASKEDAADVGEIASQDGTRFTGELSGDVEIIPDENNNAIIFKASQRDYKIIKTVLKELDIVPRQVLINVVIAEVTLSDKIQYGVQWLMNNRLGDYEAQGSWDIKDSNRVFNQTLGNNSAFSYGIFSSADILAGSVDALKALVTALDEDSELTVLSSPNIMAVDNKEAYIEVGEDVPTVTGTVTDSNGGVTNTVQYQKTGIILKVKPHINSSGLVKMELSQEVSGTGSVSGAGGNLIITTRKAETSLVVSDGQTILMGGLMETVKDKKDSGVPLLKSIPVLGHLFKASEKKNTKTELIFLLTPHVVDSRDQVTRITREFAGKIESVKELIGTGD